MPSVTVRIPDSLRLSGYIEDPINSEAKNRLASILRSEKIDTPPKPLREISVHANFWLNAVDAGRLTKMGEEAGMSVGEFISALLVQDAENQKNKRSHESPPLASTNSTKASEALCTALTAQGMQEREEQNEFSRAINVICNPDSLIEHKVLFAEAGTGVGKTLAYLVAAHEFIKANPDAHIAIAVPSHALMSKVIGDWQRLTQALEQPKKSVALLGQSEFVSVTALTSIQSEIKDIVLYGQIQEWIENGGPAQIGSLINHNWTMAGLRSAAPTFLLQASVTLEHRDTDEDQGFLSYRGQWSAVSQCGMIFMTHAMLASLTWRRSMAQSKAFKNSDEIIDAIEKWSSVAREKREQRLYEVINAIYATTQDKTGQELIPNLDLLIVDEAHQLEDAFALVLSQTVSLWSIRNDFQALHVAQPKTVKRSDVDAIEQLWRNLIARGDGDTALMGDELQSVFVSLSQVLASVCERKHSRSAESARWRRLTAVSNSLRIATQTWEKTERYIEAMVSWSPDRKWPQLTIGRIHFGREMNYLWTVIASRTCLVSGTLYEEIPQLSCESSRRSLNVPYDSMLTMEPIHAPWQYTPVTACLIGDVSTPGGRKRFLRPKADKDNELNYIALHADWSNDIAGYIIEAHKEAAGGMLVLGTAFRDLKSIAEILRNRTNTPVIEHRSGHPLASLREQYLVMAEAKMRPILLAAGGAWTGFDLHSEIEPDACTDLVIINAPFGATTRTLAREVRLRQKRGISELISQVTVLVRQGIGRLVRSPNTNANRRIHWLDAKINQSNTAGLLQPVRRVLAKYKQITVA